MLLWQKKWQHLIILLCKANEKATFYEAKKMFERTDIDSAKARTQSYVSPPDNFSWFGRFDFADQTKIVRWW